MPDITMCKGVGCEAKHTCYRYTAKPNEYRQSYFLETPKDGDGCAQYINHLNTQTIYENTNRFI